MSEIQDEFDPPFEAIEPAQCRGPLLFNSPHSGRVYPREFLQTSRLDLATLRRSEDSFVGELIEGVGRARLSRSCGRISRAAMSTSTASPTNSTRGCSTAGCRRSPIPARCGSPAGSAPWRASSATPRKSTISAFRSAKRCAGSTGSTSPITARCGACSCGCSAISAPPFWSIAIPCRRPPAAATSGRAPTSCSATATARAASAVVAETIEQCLRGFGYSVSRNKPYAGGFITEHYGNPTTGLHAIQLEINRALYMDERRYERSASFAKLAGEFEAAGRPPRRRSRSRNCGPIAPRRNSRQSGANERKRAAHLAGAAQV